MEHKTLGAGLMLLTALSLSLMMWLIIGCAVFTAALHLPAPLVALVSLAARVAFSV